MPEEKNTTLDNKIAILADLWLNYRNDENFVDFCEYNDIGLPLAYLLQEKIAAPTDLSKNFIEETFDLLVAALDLDDEEGYTSLDDMIENAQ